MGVSSVEDLRKPLLLAARGAFSGIEAIPDLGVRLREACDRLCARGLPPEREGPFRAWRRQLERFEKLPRAEQEVEVARGLRLCLHVGGPAPPLIVEEVAQAGARVPIGPLAAPLTSIPGIGPTLAARLAEKGLETIEDLAWLVPRGYEDLRQVGTLEEAIAAPPGERVGFVARVERVRYRSFGRRYLEVGLSGSAGTGLVARWFHVHGGMARRFVRGEEVVLSGKLRQRNGQWETANPDILGDPGDDAASKQVIRGRYPDVEGVAPAILRRACRTAVARAAPHIIDGIPRELADRLGLTPLGEALVRLHAPPGDLSEGTFEILARGGSEWHRRLAFDELFFLALAVLSRRAERRADHAEPCVAPPEALDAFRQALPFLLTAAQERAVEEVVRDLARPEPMNRLLQGDVGAGKTAVAFAGAHIAMAAKRQVALMAPTEILAEQHHRTIEPWAAALGHRVALLTASTPRGVRESILGMVEAGQIGLLIGTHALLAERVTFAELGLVVIDEQHRFGVAQRVRLRSKGQEEGALGLPHLLVMTATPIPRTLALTIYGDLDVTTLDELPPGRKAPETRVLWGERGREKAYQALAKAVASGERAFVVCPLIEPGEAGQDELPWADVTSTAARLTRELAPAKVGLVHGRMNQLERDAAMRALREGRLEVLVATTVIEVGVDVPEATVMVIEDADRFGLAQLHQLRGRVGRGTGRSRCLLLARGGRTPEAERRLKIMAETTDGFRIAEEDLAIRGPGEVMGARQAGLPRLRFGDLQRHAELVLLAREEARGILDRDPRLEHPAHALTAKILADRLQSAAAYGAEGG